MADPDLEGHPSVGPQYPSPQKPGSGEWKGRDALEMRRSDYKRYGSSGTGMPSRVEKRGN
jgi:hypothetical protein